ncbi:hypothetical protein BV210_18270 (plasmid) [Halorientalis sp. IM1011]|nr:hypothetical protein BV210_18270 [Halorientalis sp. IM1011]
MISAVLVQLSEIGIASGYGLAVFFLIGLLGGAHCIGMCGPLVATYAERMETDDRWSGALTLYEVRQHTLFNLGRTMSKVLPDPSNRFSVRETRQSADDQDAGSRISTAVPARSSRTSSSPSRLVTIQ